MKTVVIAYLDDDLSRCFINSFNLCFKKLHNFNLYVVYLFYSDCIQ